MCGLFGFARPADHHDPSIIDAFGRLGVLAQSRGLDAAGWAAARPGPVRPVRASLGARNRRRSARAGAWTVRKQPGPFQDLWDTTTKRQRRLLSEARVAMGHTRAASQGAVREIANCSPMMVGTIIGTHNGDIDATDLLDRFPEAEALTGGTDSEVLYAALAASGNTATVLEEVTGRAALAWADTTAPGFVYLARAAWSPLYVALDVLGALWWVSNPQWLSAARIPTRKIEQVREGTVLTIDLGGRPRVVRRERFTAWARPSDNRRLRPTYAGFSAADRVSNQARLDHRIRLPRDGRAFDGPRATWDFDEPRPLWGGR